MALHQHERSANLAQAEAALAMEVADLVERFDLTAAEVLVALSSIQSRWAGYQLRDERDSKSACLGVGGVMGALGGIAAPIIETRD